MLSLTYAIFYYNEKAQASDKLLMEKEDSTINNVKSSQFNIKAEVKNALEKINSPSAIDLIEKESTLITTSKKKDDVPEQLKKWVIREMIDTKYFENKDLSIEQSIVIAKERMTFEHAWLQLAETTYGITYDDNEVEDFIKKGPDANPTKMQLDYAQSLGLTLEELNHHYDRVFYVKHVVWNKLAPKIQEKYQLKEFDDPKKEEKDPLHNRVIRKYESEVQEFVHSSRD